MTNDSQTDTGQSISVACLEEPTLGRYGGNVLGPDFPPASAPQHEEVGGKVSFRDDLRQRGIRRRRDVRYVEAAKALKRPTQSRARKPVLNPGGAV